MQLACESVAASHDGAQALLKPRPAWGAFERGGGKGGDGFGQVSEVIFNGTENVSEIAMERNVKPHCRQT